MSPCQNCHAGCCRSFAVPVTGADVLRIERDLGLDFWEFACRWADPDGNIARQYAPQFYFDDDPETPYVICLTQGESRFLTGSVKCRFLMECPPDEEHPLGQARCGIYGQRPAACRVFPTKLNDTAELVLLHDVPERGRDGNEPAYTLCPDEWSPADFDPLDAMQHLVLAKYEMAFFQQLAKTWNRRPRAWRVFPDFLRAVYAGRVVRETPEEESETIRFPGVSAPPATERSKAA